MDRETWLASELDSEEEFTGRLFETAAIYHPDQISLHESPKLLMDSFRKGSGDIYPNNKLDSGLKPFADVEEALKLSSLNRYLDIEPDTVYYPGCGVKTTPSAVFPDSDIVYLDKDGVCVEKLLEEGYNAVQADAESYKLEEEHGYRPDMIYMQDYTGEAPAETVSGNEKSGQWIMSDIPPDYYFKDRFKSSKITDTLTEKHSISNRMETKYSASITEKGYIKISEGVEPGISATRIEQ